VHFSSRKKVRLKMGESDRDEYEKSGRERIEERRRGGRRFQRECPGLGCSPNMRKKEIMAIRRTERAERGLPRT